MPVTVVMAAWFVAAVAVGVSGLLARSPVPPPAIALTLAAGVLVFLRRSATARGAVFRLGPKPLVAFHLVRVAAGAYFLVLYRQGVLPVEFALVAGWGDIAVGLGAVAVLATCIPLRTRGQHTALGVWNAAGLVDILLVLGNGARLFVRNPAIGQPFTDLPLALLPVFVVPIVIVAHILVFAWYRRMR